ncbi:long-chain-fatty-acid---luciferin-component ligase [Anaerobacterium chartisolvens]|uniref:Long-chain-fatty-acid---luciferin-component ligase n=1 Tax=Anaerobacterium chartisolvens TaxID=1297424 RepID=A0A369AP62_9FIRM|nr:hypothetical protein [Anaerobacterium chartisolvens]RCX11150.1 long-chain-fatty-acid---luciferin-component ligase [Anaerobacterium chartisolvens]
MSGLKNNCLSDIDYLQLYLEDIFKDELSYREAQNRSILNTFRFHLSNNKGYREYVEELEPNIDNIIGNFDVASIPLLPSAFFKRHDIRLSSVDDDEIIKHCTSSGTKGSLSVVPRDELTLINFLGSISSGLSCIFDLERTGNHKAFVLGPNPEESGDLWFSYVLSSMAISFNTEYFEHNGYFDVAYAAERIEEAVRNNNEVLIISPPFRIVELCNWINQLKLSIKLKGNSFVISAGGWKNMSNKAIPREDYTSLVTDTFKIDSRYVRDSYNMVELNSVINECECHEKHILPWVEAFARDPKTNEVLKDGQLGILSFYDGSSLSYPCFILSEDYGIVSLQKCKCGRVGKRIKIVKRMEGIEARGCALKMATSNASIKTDASNRFYKSYYRNPDMYLK